MSITVLLETKPGKQCSGCLVCICICIYIASITALRRNTPASQARGAAAAGYITPKDPSHLTFAHLSASVAHRCAKE